MTITTAEREAILTEIDQSWDELITELRGFTETELRTPNVIGIWSLKDLLGHLATWDQIAIRKIELAEAGSEMSWWEAEGISAQGINEFNEADADAKREMSFDQLWTDLYTTHDAMLQRVRETPALSRELVREDTYAHYRDHLNDIRRWQEAG